jgi:hypothetical protein
LKKKEVGANINLGNGVAKHYGVVKQQGTKGCLVLGFMQSKGAKQSIRITKHHVASKYARTTKHKNSETLCHIKAHKNNESQE